MAAAGHRCLKLLSANMTSSWIGHVRMLHILHGVVMLHSPVVAGGRPCLKLFSANMTSSWIGHVRMLHMLHGVVIEQPLQDS